MISAIRHRGPDGWGVHEPVPGVALGHTRLAVSDLVGGAQPMTRDALTSSINGQLYDYHRLRRAIESKGDHLLTWCDSELILPLYQRYREAFLQQIEGEFALAIYDSRARRLVLARDRMGTRPLYFLAAKNRFLFGSEIKAIFAFGDVSRELDPEGVVTQLMHVLPPGRTPFTGIRELRPGHMLEVVEHNGELEISTKAWWTLPDPPRSYGSHPKTSEFAEQALDALHVAVQRRLHANVPLACYLSGGIDSAAIMALANQNQTVPALTIGFEDATFDEATKASDTAQALQAPHHICRLSTDELFGRAYEDTVWHTERVMYGTLGVARRKLAAHARELGFSVVLTGDGSDELFGGYVQFERDMALAHPDAKARISRLHRRLGLPGAPAEEAMAHPALNKLWGGTPSWIQLWLLALVELRPLLSRRLQETLRDYDPVVELAQSIASPALHRMHPLDRAQTTWIKTMLPSYILGWAADRVDMAHGVESRPPFLDTDLVELARRLPPAFRIRENQVKWLLRVALKGTLPESIRTRAKRGFVAPPGNTCTAWNTLLNRWLNPEQVKSADLFDPQKIQSFRVASENDHYAQRRKNKMLHQLVGLQIIHDRLCRQ